MSSRLTARAAGRGAPKTGTITGWRCRRHRAARFGSLAVVRGYDRRMDLFAVRERRGGPWDWTRDLREQAGFGDHARFMDELVESGFVVLGGPLEGEREVLLVIDAPSEETVRERLAEDPWIPNGMLTVTSIERWTILLDGRG